MDKDAREVCICSKCLAKSVYSEEEVTRKCIERGCFEDVGDPLAFIGLDSMSPAMIWIDERDPTKEDIVDGDGEKFCIGGIWINKKANDVWMLEYIKNKEASWVCIKVVHKSRNA